MSTNILNEPHHLLLADTLTGLIKREKKLTPAALARKLGIPTNKITRIVNGDVTDPKASTLIQIASYFDITIQQLLGLEPIAKEASRENQEQTITQSLRIYEFSRPQHMIRQWYNWVSNEIDGDYFALSMDTDLYEPVFPLNSLLIVNPSILPEDRSFVVMQHKDNQNYSIKKHVLEDSKVYLYSINPKMPIESLDNSLYTTAGVILEVHQKLNSKNKL